MRNSALQSIPKVELHCHLELCFRHQTLLEIAPSIGLEVPKDPKSFRDDWLICQPMDSLAEVLQKFTQIQKFWSSEELIERLTFEAIEDASAQNIRILELRYAPHYIAEKSPHLNFDRIHQSILRGVKRASHLPIAVGLIGIIQRILPLPRAAEVSEFIIGNKNSFVGVDLADNEVGFDCRPFAPFFQKAKEEGMRITVHSGEENVPEGPQFVRNAINELGAERIGHGIQVIKDPEVVKEVIDKGVVLEVCSTSNWLTNAVSSIKEHPLPELIKAGVLCTINSDDPSMFGLDLTSEYQTLIDHLGFSIDDLERCNDIAAKHSFIPLEERQKVWPEALS